MSRPAHLTHLARNLTLALAGLAMAAAVAAQEAAPPSASSGVDARVSSSGGDARIYQQRTADGRTVLTDRPAADAVTERTWKAVREDPSAAHQRREDARLAAQAVSDRLQRQIDAQQQRDHEITLARMQLAAAQARLEAERAVAAAEESAGLIVVGPGFVHRPPLRPPHHPMPRPWQVRMPGAGGFGMYGPLPG